MKKFFMITPLQPVGVKEDGTPFDYLRMSSYEPVGNTRLEYDRQTRFPLMHVINGYAEPGEEIRVIAITPEYEYAKIHLNQLQEEVAQLAEEKGFICKEVEPVYVPFAGDVANQIEVFHKLLSYVDHNDMLYGCLTYGMKPMPIAELMALQYAYRVLENVSIECLVYGEVDYSVEPQKMRLFDITALIQLDEIVRVLADQKVMNPKGVIDQILEMVR